MRSILSSLIFPCVLLASENGFAASEITGTVRTININRTWGGIFIQLDSAPMFEANSACASSFVFAPILDDYTKHFVAIATAAKSTGEPIRIATSGCVSTPMGQVPKIEWIDFGIRL